MSGDDRFYYDDNPDDAYQPEPYHTEPEEAKVSASMIFTEMMRRAASARMADARAVENPVPPPAPVEPPPRYATPEDRQRAAALEAQRIQRVQRRRERRRRQTVGIFGGIVRSFLVIGISGVLIATILSFWIDPQSLSPEVRANRQAAAAGGPAELIATSQPTPNWMRQIGIVSGHRGGPIFDPGAVCPDGLTENEINFAVAQQVVLDLRGRGYSVDLLEEFDPRLENYQAAALISIHSNDCSPYDGSRVSGFLVSQAEARAEGGEDTRLRECVAEGYGRFTGLERRFGLTRDMTDYHIFRSLHSRTPGVIVELGFMLADRALLTEQQGLLAQGIVAGILCFLEPAPINVEETPAAPQATPAP